MNELTELAVLLEELKRRQKHQSNTYVPDDHPQRNQKLFHQSKQRYRLLLGGNRSGKSRSSAQEIFWWVTNSHPFLKTPEKPRIWVLSTEYRTIFEGIWMHLKNVLPEWDIEKIGARIVGHDIPSFIETKKGGRIDFISAQGGDETRKKLQAAEIDLLVIDEEIPSHFWMELRMRLLTRGGKLVLSATLVESEDWILDLEDRFNSGDPNVLVVHLDTRFNKYNDAELLKELLGEMSDEEKEVRILGNRRGASGLIYTNWLEANTPERVGNLLKPFPIPNTWPRIMCVDPGFRVFAGLWVAISPLNLGIAYREMYLKNTNLQEVVQFIRSAERDESIRWRLIDSAAFRHYEDGSLAEGYKLNDDYGFDFIPCTTKDKKTNIDDVCRWLMPTRHTDSEGRVIPGFRIFDTLSNFRSERKRYKIAPDSPDGNRPSRPDKPIAKFNHLMNCVEYIASFRYEYERPPTEKEELQRLARQRNEDIEFPPGPEGRMLQVRLHKERMRQKWQNLAKRY